MAEAHHKQGQGKEVVGIKTLRVLVDGNDIDGWMAQGLEIDYFVCAKTEQSVKRNFVEGLTKTIALYLLEDGSTGKLLEAAPMEVWKEYYQAISNEQKAVSSEVEIDFPSEAAANEVVFNKVAFLSSPI